MILEDAQLCFFALVPALDGAAQEAPLGCDEARKPPLQGRVPTVSIPVEALRDAWLVSEHKFRRRNCLAFFVQGQPSEKGVTIAIATSSSEVQSAWVDILRRVVCGELSIPRLSPTVQIAGQMAVDEGRTTQQDDSSVEDTTSISDCATAPADFTCFKGKGCAKGRGKAPVAPGKAAPKGRGKGPPVAPPVPVAKGAGKARGKPGKGARPPLGRVLTVKPMDHTVKLEDTVFGAMVPLESEDSQDEKDESEESDSAVAGALREAFSAATNDSASRFEAARRRKASKRGVIDSRTAQNAEIVLRRLSIGVEDLRHAMDTLDFNVALSVEELERLRFSLPSSNQLKPLLEYRGDTSQLRDIEQKLLILGQVERMNSRLHVLSLKKSLLPRRQTLLEETNRVRCACSELMESRILRDLLEAVLRMFNFVNHGIERLERGTVRGFDITSALRVAEFKAVGNAGTGVPFTNFTGLHFIVSQVLQKRPYVTWRDLHQELLSLPGGAGLNVRCIASDARDLLREASFLATETSEFRASYESKPDIEEEARPQAADSELNCEPLLSPVPELTSVRRSTPSWNPARDAAVQQLPEPGKLLTCFAPRGASLLCEELPSLEPRWRFVRVGPGGSLEVHSKAKTRTVSLQGAVIRPLETARESAVPPPASCSQEASHVHRVLGVEVSTEEGSLRFLCSTEEEVNQWVTRLRSEASNATAGWLKLAKVTSGGDGEQAFRRWWCVFDPDNREFRYYRSAMAARRISSMPSGRISVSGWDGLRCISGNASQISCRGVAESSDENCELQVQRKSFTVNTREGAQYVLMAASEAARDAVLSIIKKQGLTARFAQQGSQREEPNRQCAETASRTVCEKAVGDNLSNRAPSIGRSDSTISPAMPRALPQPGYCSESDSDSESSFTNSSNGDSDSGESECELQPRASQRPQLPQLNLKQLVHSSTRSQAETDATMESSSSTGSLASHARNQPTRQQPAGLGHFGFASSDEGESEEDCLPTDRLGLVQKIERLKDTAALAEVEINAALRETCQQAAQTMRYFGQIAPSEVDFESDALIPFGQNLQQFLQAVDRFIQQVTIAWKDMEKRQQQRRGQGLSDSGVNTPRAWAPVSARGERPRAGSATPRAALRTPRRSLP